MLVVLDRNLLGQVGHRRVDTVCDSLNDKAIDIVDIAEPLNALLVCGTDVIDRVLHELVDLFAFTSDGFETSNDSCVVLSLDVIGALSPHLSLEEGLLAPHVHDLNHLADVLLHLLDELVDVGDDDHSLVDEGIDILGVPLEGVDT